MANLNKVMLIGNLTRDPELKYTPKGMAIAQLGLAVNRVWSNEAGEKQEEVTFIDVEMFGRKAEVAAEYLKKGRPVFIEGRLKLDSWDDKASGQKRSKLKVVGESLEFLGSREGGGGESGGEGRPQRPAGKPAAPPKRPPADPDLDAPEDDIPF
ncbi:MAG: single-stranded DNA-binding protein [Chthoniobacteraceae bacterium]